MRTERWRDRRRGEGGNVQNDEVSGNDEERQWDALGAGGIWVEFFLRENVLGSRETKKWSYICVCVCGQKKRRDKRLIQRWMK